MTHRQLASLLFWLDRIPPCAARWELEAIILDALTERVSTAPPPRPASGVFLLGPLARDE